MLSCVYCLQETKRSFLDHITCWLSFSAVTQVSRLVQVVALDMPLENPPSTAEYSVHVFIDRFSQVGRSSLMSENICSCS